MKLTCSKSNPPIVVLAVIELVNEFYPIEIEWSDNDDDQISIKYDVDDGAMDYQGRTMNDTLRFLARYAIKYSLYGNTVSERTQVDHWLTFSGRIQMNIPGSIEYLNRCLLPVTYLVGHNLTIADLSVFHEMYRCQKTALLKKKNSEAWPENLLRWYNLILEQDVIKNTLSKYNSSTIVVKGSDNSNNNTDEIPIVPEKQHQPKQSPTTHTSSSSSSSLSQRKQEGKFIDLPGAELGKVVVRFPPEASGYLHIGHAKAALLNQYYQQAFQGKFIMRFDDTNPAKENVEFEKVILEDVEMLNIKPDLFTHTSDYFELMLEYCEKLLNNGKAYVDDTDPEQMKKEREQKIESVNRNNDVAKNFAMWKEMLNGTALGQKCCVRAKIDMASLNGCLRDPTIYRCKNEPHPKTGTKYKVYPTYDFACPIVDAIENVTHTLRTMEYHDRDDQFYWFIDALELRKPYIWEYSRLNMTNTVLSKRKLAWFVEENLVDGWDDPRFPTVRGILRRGMTVEGLREFIIAQGSSKSVVFMEWDKIWAFNKKVIDPIAPRYTALEQLNRVTVNVTGIPTNQQLEVPAHPKNSAIGMKTIWIGPKILIDQCDAEQIKEMENVTFINWGNLLINKINRDGNNKITSIDATSNLDNKDFKKTLKLTWLCDLTDKNEFPPTICVYFDHIISKNILAKNEDFKQFIGHQTKVEVSMLGDPELKKCKKGDIIQLQRRGFFRVDNAYEPASLNCGIKSPIILFEIPDGHVKEKSVIAPTPKESLPLPNKCECSSDLLTAVPRQANLVRELKAKKADKSEIDAAVKLLLELKAQYKSIIGKDWKAEETPKHNENNNVTSVNKASAKDIRGNLTERDDSLDSKIMEAMKTLNEFKSDYKAKTGKEWTPSTSSISIDISKLNVEIIEQGNIVRDLKSKKAPKNVIDDAIKNLLDLKTAFKDTAGYDWKPDSIPVATLTHCSVQSSPPTPAASSDISKINSEIIEQGNIVRDLKARKSPKNIIDDAVKKLLDLKAAFKGTAGYDWKPDSIPVATPLHGSVQSAPSPPPTASSDISKINSEIIEQGNLVRDLKAKKSPKNIIDEAVKKLLALKANFKDTAGYDWKPDSIPVASTSPVSVQPSSPQPSSDIAKINNEIIEQGNIVRDLKSKKFPKNIIDDAVKKLLALKSMFKESAGYEWTPDAIPLTVTVKIEKPDSPLNNKENYDEAIIYNKVADQGDKIRKLKSDKVDKSLINSEVKILLDLKQEYKKLIGKDWTPNEVKIEKKTPKKDSKQSGGGEQISVETSPKDDSMSGGLKKQTRLGLEARKEENLPDWYSQIITKGEMIEYYDVSGCYILRHWSFAIWKIIKKFFDDEITKLGVKECYFPMFVSRAALEKEKTHIADFAPEVAWVTKSGDSELAEPIAVRPTSETVMYPAYAKWIQSHRDLPLRLNQWNNVVRWEFKHPQPFLRTREFLWQEGHTAFANAQDACDEVLQILDLYAQVYTDYLAIPVVKGRKTEKEKFAGGEFTTTVEAYISASGRAIQGATSHHLGQNFSKMFEIVFDDPVTQEKTHVYQNSWGITTRSIGVMIMVHGDNQGLVLPPRVACIQVIIVPCGITATTKEDEKEKLLKTCDELEKKLTAVNVRCETDYRDNYSPGWKFNHWELKGVPIRIEIGPKDMKQEQIVAVRRDNGEKLILKQKNVADDIGKLLEDIHCSMFNRAQADLNSHTKITKNWSEFCKLLDAKNIILSPFCGDMKCEDTIKAESARDDAELEPGAPAMGAKSLCIPFEQPTGIDAADKCIHPRCTARPKAYVLFGRSY